MSTLVGPDGQPVTAQTFHDRVLGVSGAMYKAAEDGFPDMSIDEFLTAVIFMYCNGMASEGKSRAFASSRAKLGIARMWPGVSAAVKQQKESEKK